MFTLTKFLALKNKYKEVTECLEAFLKHLKTDFVMINEYSEKDMSKQLQIIQKKSNQKGQVKSLNEIITILKKGKYDYWIEWEEGWIVHKPVVKRAIDIIKRSKLQLTKCKVYKKNHYHIPIRKMKYYNNASNNSEVCKWSLFSLRASINDAKFFVKLGKLVQKVSINPKVILNTSMRDVLLSQKVVKGLL